MSEEAPIETKEDPERLELRAKPRTVVRLNRRMIVALVGILALILLFVVMRGFRTSKPVSTPASAPSQNTERVARAEGLESLPRDYASLPKVTRLGPPMGELGAPLLKSEREAGIPELPERPGFQPDPQEQAFRAQRLKEKTEEDQAARATVFFQIKRSTTPQDVASTPSGAGSDRLAAGAPSPWPVAPVAESNTPSEPNRQSDKRAFVDKKMDAAIYATGTLQTPRSPYQLMAGSIVPAALVTGIQSDLPGQVIAAITENVYDSVTGHALLIPQGARLLGQYDSGVSFGQRRILLVWTRLIMPNGSSIVLDRLPATDSQGYAGLEDKVDWHWGRIFSGAMLATLLGAGAELAVPQNRDGSDRVVIATGQGAQDTLNQVGQEITRRNLDIQPTLTARPGLPVRVIVNRDLVLRPYKESL